MPTRAAGRDVKRRTASSSVISFSSRTYLPRTRGNDPQARGCDFDSESGPSSARAPESVPIEIIGCDNASRTSSSRMIEMITEVSPRSAMTRSIAASRGSLPISLPIWTSFLPSHLRSAGSTTVDTITPAPPPDPYHWFSQSFALAIVHVALDAIALGGILQPLQHRFEAALADPQRQARVETVRGAIVRIHVGRDVEAARARGLEVLEHLAHASPVGLVGGLQVPHFRGNVGALGHREHLVERGDDLVRLRTLVRDVDAAMLPRDRSRARRSRRCDANRSGTYCSEVLRPSAPCSIACATSVFI